MNSNSSAMVVFSVGSDRSDFFNEQLRQATLERGVATILARIEGLRLITSSKFACTASVTGPLDAIEKLEKFVEDESLGAVEREVFEKPAMRAAGGRF